MRAFPHLTIEDLRDMLADLDSVIGDGSERRSAEEAMAWEIEEELLRRDLEDAADEEME